MSAEVDLAPAAALLGEPARAAIVLALMDGRALPAGELARVAGVSAQTATSHLKKLLAGGFLSARSQGRHRYYRLSSAKIARAVEALSAIAPPPQIRSLSQSVRVKRLAFARTCYDHLAGELGVRIAEALVTAGRLRVFEDGFAVTAAGAEFFKVLGIRAAGGDFVRSCIDWTQRRPHAAGSLGTALLQALVERRYLERTAGDRALTLTDAGAAAIEELFYRDAAAASGRRSAPSSGIV